MQCPKCEGEMAQGFVAEYVHTRNLAPVWYSGRPKRSFWGTLDVRNRASFYVQSWRCTQCGYLENYAV